MVRDRSEPFGPDEMTSRRTLSRSAHPARSKRAPAGGRAWKRAGSEPSRLRLPPGTPPTSRLLTGYRAPLIRGHRSPASAGEGLPSSRHHLLNVPCPVRRTVPRGCTSRVFTASMAFAVITAARHCHVPQRRGRLRFTLRTAQLLPPMWLSTLGSDPAVHVLPSAPAGDSGSRHARHAVSYRESQAGADGRTRPASPSMVVDHQRTTLWKSTTMPSHHPEEVLPGSLATTRTGLSPAGDDELPIRP